MKYVGNKQIYQTSTGPKKTLNRREKGILLNKALYGSTPACFAILIWSSLSAFYMLPIVASETLGGMNSPFPLINDIILLCIISFSIYPPFILHSSSIDRPFIFHYIMEDQWKKNVSLMDK
jgi:hypothetical protein